jgi:GAF domain-containing protein
VGVLAVGSSRPEPLPADTESRIGAFTELVATAIANAETRQELEQIAAEQARGQPRGDARRSNRRGE